MAALKVTAALFGTLSTCIGCDLIQIAIDKSSWWFLAGSVFPFYMAYQCFDISLSPFIYDLFVERLYRHFYPRPDVGEHPPADHPQLERGEDQNEQREQQDGHAPENLLQELFPQGVPQAQPLQNHQALQLLQLANDLLPGFDIEVIEEIEIPNHLPNGRPHIMQ